MPYGGERNSEEVRKIESCVKQKMAEGKSKSSAVAICKASILQRRGSKSKEGARHAGS